MSTEEQPGYRSLIRSISDFPKPGINFYDLMPMLAHADAFAECIHALAAPWRTAEVDVVMAIEARGFLFGSALARQLDAGLVPLRKAGKLPGAVHRQEYQLEYGSEQLELQRGVVCRGQRALLMDDVLATGGTLAAGHALAQAVDADIVGAAVVIEIESLAGRGRWPDSSPVHALMTV